MHVYIYIYIYIHTHLQLSAQDFCPCARRLAKQLKDAFDHRDVQHKGLEEWFRVWGLGLIS